MEGWYCGLFVGFVGIVEFVDGQLVVGIGVSCVFG